MLHSDLFVREKKDGKKKHYFKEIIFKTLSGYLKKKKKLLVAEISKNPWLLLE